MCGIYKITNTLNNKCYIGQSINIEERWRRYRKDARKKEYPLYLAMRKYGMENFTFEVLEECGQEELNDKEMAYINYYNSYEDGYNATTGGDAGYNNEFKITKEELKKIYDLLMNTDVPQGEIAKRFNVGQDTISYINHGKSRRQIGYTYPLRNNQPRTKYYCKDCGKEIYRGSTYCVSCYEANHKRQHERPSREELKEFIRTTPFTRIAERFNVSDASIRKWCKAYDLPYRVKDIKMISDSEWEKI